MSCGWNPKRECCFRGSPKFAGRSARGRINWPGDQTTACRPAPGRFCLQGIAYQCKLIFFSVTCFYLLSIYSFLCRLHCLAHGSEGGELCGRAAWAAAKFDRAFSISAAALGATGFHSHHFQEVGRLVCFYLLQLSVSRDLTTAWRKIRDCLTARLSASFPSFSFPGALLSSVLFASRKRCKHCAINLSFSLLRRGRRNQGSGATGSIRESF
jgi:hypothetical protein